jgi:putative transposase
MITKMKATPASCLYSTAELCTALEVSPSGFYAHQNKAKGVRRQQDTALAEQIGLLFVQSRHTYGCRRLRESLRREDLSCGTNRICPPHARAGLASPSETPFSTSHHPEPPRSAHRPEPVGQVA